MLCPVELRARAVQAIRKRSPAQVFVLTSAFRLIPGNNRDDHPTGDYAAPARAREGGHGKPLRFADVRTRAQWWESSRRSHPDHRLAIGDEKTVTVKSEFSIAARLNYSATTN